MGWFRKTCKSCEFCVMRTGEEQKIDKDKNVTTTKDETLYCLKIDGNAERIKGAIGLFVPPYRLLPTAKPLTGFNPCSLYSSVPDGF